MYGWDGDMAARAQDTGERIRVQLDVSDIRSDTTGFTLWRTYYSFKNKSRVSPPNAVCSNPKNLQSAIT